MTVFNWILISLGAIIVIPILAFLIMRSGTVGFYRGKEVWKERDQFNNSVQNENENES